MASPPETVEKFEKTLDAYIKPREQVNYIRRVLALHLGSSSQDGPLKQPASLADTSRDIYLGQELRGVQRQYLEALKANVEARRTYEDAVQANASQPASRPQSPAPASKSDVLEERIALLKLQNKQQRLAIVREYLDILGQKPAASPAFLHAEGIFEGVPDLPSVPKEVVSSLVAEKSTAKPDLKSQVARLEKTVLRTKLLLRREEQLLQETRARAQNIPDVLSHGTRLEALTATRNELINWIETELGKASGGDDVEEDGISSGQNRDKMNADKATVNKQLSAIRQKYARYLDSRKSLIESMAQRSESSRQPVLQPIETDNLADESLKPSSYLLTPYIETLLSVSRKQKGLIAQKSHMNSALGRQNKDAGQILGHLAEESQLLPQYPMKGAARRMSVMGGDEMVLTSSERASLSGRIQPWVFAADSAKIATLETVAEKVEGGQVALENTMETLHDIDHLLGLDKLDQTEEAEEEPTEDDVWINAGSRTPGSARKHTEKRKDQNKPKDLWSNLHGNLGLLGNEDSA